MAVPVQHKKNRPDNGQTAADLKYTAAFFAYFARSLARFPPQKFANELLHSSTHEIIFPKLVKEIEPISPSLVQGASGGLDPNVQLIYWIPLGQSCWNTLYPTPSPFLSLHSPPRIIPIHLALPLCARDSPGGKGHFFCRTQVSQGPIL